MDKETSTRKVWVQIQVRPWKLTGGMGQIQPLLKYATYFESPFGITINWFQLDNIEEQQIEYLCLHILHMCISLPRNVRVCSLFVFFFFLFYPLGINSPQALKKILSLSEEGSLDRHKKQAEDTISNASSQLSSPPTSPQSSPRKGKCLKILLMLFLPIVVSDVYGELRDYLRYQIDHSPWFTLKRYLLKEQILSKWIHQSFPSQSFLNGGLEKIKWTVSWVVHVFTCSAVIKATHSACILPFIVP